MDYRVEWIIDIFDVANPIEAARKARESQIRPGTSATIFDVYEHKGDHQLTRVDLMEAEEELKSNQQHKFAEAKIAAIARPVQNVIPVVIAPGKTISLSPGDHSELIRAIIEDFAPRFAPGSVLVYAGDTGEKWGYFDKELLSGLGVEVDAHGKMPDVVLYFKEKNWLLLVESVTSHGPVDGKRHVELSALFAEAEAGLVYVTAFPNRAIMGRYLSDIAWETEVWVADSPSHLIHFNGERFLGPYADE
jgi:hypothetical protein